MLFKINPHKLFFASVLYSGFLGYLFGSGIVAYGPMILMLLLVIVYEVTTKNKLGRATWLAFLLWLPYVLWAGFVYMSFPFEGRLFGTHLLSILFLPFLILVFSRFLLFQSPKDGYSYVYSQLLLFLALQLFVCLGQISTYTLGFGFPVNELHADASMVSGTFINSNDLAAIVLACLFFVAGLERYFFRKDKALFWVFAVVLLLITGSRSAVVMAGVLFLVTKLNRPAKLLYHMLFLASLVAVLYFVVSGFSNEVVYRFVTRIESLIHVLQHGAATDNSLTVRLSSYVHFLNNIPRLGLGSGEINNYFKYSVGADFGSSELLFKNPHSLIVEIGYWLGWPGLVFFLMPLLLLLKHSRRKLQLVFVFLIVSMIPSSILSSMLFFLLLVLCFYDYREKNANPLSPPTSS